MWYVTFYNSGDKPIGNISYRTSYVSETGGQVDKGGVDSFLGGHVVSKVIPPNQKRTIEINDGFLNSQAYKANFEVVSCEFVTDAR
jgi:hypothetical protein